MKSELSGSSLQSYSPLICQEETPEPVAPTIDRAPDEAQRRAEAAARRDQIVSNGGAVERVRVSSRGARPGETYEQCNNRYRLEAARAREFAGMLAGCIGGGGSGLVAAASIAHPAVKVLAAASGCLIGALTQAASQGAAGLQQGEAEGKVACDGAPGSPEAARPPAPLPPPSPPGASCPDGREVNDTGLTPCPSPGLGRGERLQPENRPALPPVPPLPPPLPRPGEGAGG